MDSLKFILTSLIVLGILVLVGFWAVRTIEPGNLHVEKQKAEELATENQELKKQVLDLQSEIANLKSAQGDTTGSTASIQAPSTPTPPTVATKYQTLINELQKLADDKVYMKEKSKGTRVGTIQKFLNIYNNTSNRADNDYGASTKKAVAAFQKAEGLTADGETGPETYEKMIEWLEQDL